MMHTKKGLYFRRMFFGHFMLDFVVLGQDMLYRCLASGSLSPEQAAFDEILASLCFISGQFMANGTINIVIKTKIPKLGIPI